MLKFQHISTIKYDITLVLRKEKDLEHHDRNNEHHVIMVIMMIVSSGVRNYSFRKMLKKQPIHQTYAFPGVSTASFRCFRAVTSDNCGIEIPQIRVCLEESIIQSNVKPGFINPQRLSNLGVTI